MFSGIIQAVVPVHQIYKETTHFIKYTIKFPPHLLIKLTIGSSISNNGCCLTVVSINQNLVSFHIIHETLKLTNMNKLKIGDLINIEKSIRYNSRIGGHLMNGHVDCTGEIKKVINFKKNKIIWIKINNNYFQKYIIQQGSIGIDGVSLTINKILNNYIRICLIPHTTNNTTLGIKKTGNIVNIEIDFITKIITNTTEKILYNANYTLIRK
ncbi:riboflavin synthase, alpha subunit [Candidatus Blochmanniella vafra str. BVAF]|uniref:Riboflavin synthase n=1 Tax=Blochmanniella vafra (strain BVAF) TaxID=859654 RepID=E8Q668_BLOVB|nr:riboflavin synthase [Candidatus Blochmannia vafer]ADV33762.1 riboflavin synthase, alpha subunit [Candidatus Blochmannia vafer str. BVAF]